MNYKLTTIENFVVNSCKCIFTVYIIYIIQYACVLYMYIHRATPEYSFMDFVKGGCQISLQTAIDFTVSMYRLQIHHNM